MENKINLQFNSDLYWENRYKQGGNSGSGSYNELAIFKATIINKYIKNIDINSILDYGVGDGNQLKLINTMGKKYVGIDVSPTIINKCKKLFKNDNTKNFFEVKDYDKSVKFDLVLSCDVLYHLIDERVYSSYLDNLFNFSSKYIIIYANNTNYNRTSPHVKFRKFVDFIKSNYKDWKLVQHIPNKYTQTIIGQNNHDLGLSSFYIYKKEGVFENIIFTNDNNALIKLPNDNFKLWKQNYSSIFKHRNQHEVMFRKLVTYLINNNIIDKNQNIIDLGSWIGDNSIPWAMNIDGYVYAIDPSHNNISYIEQLCKINNIHNIKTINKVIGNKIEVVSTNEDINHCSFQSNSNLLNKRNSTTLDILHKNNQIDNIGFIHLDVQGFEYKVIQGAKQVIDKYRPIITFEQHISTDNYHQIVKFLNDHKYVSYMINEKLPGCRNDCRNFISFPSLDLQKINNINKHLNLKTNNENYCKADIHKECLISVDRKNIINLKTLFFNNLEIKVIHIARSISNFYRIRDIFLLEDYDPKKHIHVPVLFFGMYEEAEYNLIKNHTGKKYILWGGSDASMVYVNKIKNMNIMNFSSSPEIHSRLLNQGIDSQKFVLWATYPNLFYITKPKKFNKIYIYNGSCPENNWKYGKDIYTKVVKQLEGYEDIEFVFSDKIYPHPYEKMCEIYQECFIGLRLTSKDACAITIQELSLMGIPCLHNCNDYPNVIKYNSVDNIVTIIKECYKNRFNYDRVNIRNQTLTLMKENNYIF